MPKWLVLSIGGRDAHPRRLLRGPKALKNVKIRALNALLALFVYTWYKLDYYGAKDADFRKNYAILRKQCVSIS